MKFTIIAFITVSLLAIVHRSFSQQSAIKIFAEVPVQFGIEYEGQVSKRFSAAVSLGLLTKPNSTIIVNVLEMFGTDAQIALMIDGAFELGVVGRGAVHYNFKKNYVGGFFEVIGLHAGDTPTELIEIYYDTSVSSYPVKRGRNGSPETNLHLNSTLYQAGGSYGRRFPLKNRRFEIDAEFAISANVGSQSKLSSDTRDLTALSNEVNAELKYYYSNYAFVPSVKLAIVYKLK